MTGPNDPVETHEHEIGKKECTGYGRLYYEIEMPDLIKKGNLSGFDICVSSSREIYTRKDW